ncbi:hypothetical protein X747_22820 [Mesorhizobium sp. LNJC384A00]|uniref:hypothetical protein n=1 Tax=unclassified Mesorhizobium TaxID=325217 RepID=UPI0003CEFB3D|nr:hypothetical protein [Mesorhizobium sp. LNJC384A00]ESY39647.1 hypothetical protein X747_22820 [Mesorhizobium sp. LNJC384A00]
MREPACGGLPRRDGPRLSSQALISDLVAQFADSLDKTFGQLDAQQRKAFDDLRVLVNQNQRWIYGDVQEGLQTVQDLNVEISNLAISSSKPVVTRFTPTYIAQASQSDDVLIEVEGFHLYDAESRHKPSLRFGALLTGIIGLQPDRP